MTDDDLTALRDRCDRHLTGHGPVRAADLLATIPADTEVDVYGDGGVVAALEAEVARLLGKPAAVFLPSGIMAQQAVLRVHADRTGRRTVLFHPTCHLAIHEDGALERVLGLHGRTVGDPNRLITLEDLRAVAEPPAALLLELPQRELGGLLPDWDDVLEQVAWARSRGAAVHCDGARIWEASAGSGRSPAELAELAEPFDSVYVSFYKGIGALAGCCLAGEEDVVAEVREWRKRLGGTLYGLWPAAASALTLLPQRLARMPEYLAHARAIAAALSDVDGVRVLPDPPQVPMMHLLLAAPHEQVRAAVRRIAETRGIFTFRGIGTTQDPGVQRVELSVGEATMRLTPEEVAAVFRELVDGLAPRRASGDDGHEPAALPAADAPREEAP
ncbi:threonine aldolase family protein [Amnibacterium kyonggiense]|uniref:L-threonine aldolase n=1 Tax=Amnibacterium kyonggiense TaxID=595671 RepID=A0A4V3EAM9_9MICO|nr:beta-eliminating lyase-related protein [Amnibacterium kyonggiense]TDS77224.1 L-threonine aldolase [Amnibacterium kyonggiense]